MKRAICHYSFHRRWQRERWDVERLAREVKALGVDGYDIHASYLKSPRDAVEQAGRAVRQTGLTLAALSLANDFAEESADTNLNDWIAAARDCGAPLVRIFGSRKKNSERVRAAVESGIDRHLPMAESAGVVLAIENHGGYPATAQDQVALIRKFNSRFLRATVDIGNYLPAGQQPLDGVSIAAPVAAYVHVKDTRSRLFGLRRSACVLGRGDIDVRACLQMLKENRYEGILALEYEAAEAEETGVPACVKYFLDELDEF